eukprot:symbB.v1.2.031135.t2/scaffold3581.1/size55290/4
MGCGLCAPKAARYKSTAVSPSAQSVGKAFSDGEAHAGPSASRGRPDSWRAGREAAPAKSEDSVEAGQGPREGPRDAAEAEPSPQVELPGMPEGRIVQAEICEEPDKDVSTQTQAKHDRAEGADRAVLSEPAQPAIRPKSSPKSKASSPKAKEKPTEDEDSSDDSVDEEEMEATLRAVAEVLTPRRQSQARKATEAGAAGESCTMHGFQRFQTKAPVPQPPPVRSKVSTISAPSTRPLYEITSPMSKPQVEDLPFPPVKVSTSTQLLLLTWARWGRNNCRIKQEEQIKSLQHRRFPRSPPPPVQLSPQPTPRESTPGGSSPPRTGAAAWRAGGELGMGTTVHSREGGSPGRAFDFAELREDQRDSMAQQGTRMRLTRGLGGSAAQAHSLGTPGFGVDTPGFPGGSGVASADASVASSGVASPVKAEALCEETEEEGSPGGGGWGLEPELDTLLMLEQEILGKRSQVVEPQVSEDSIKPQKEVEDQAVLDEDELERVEMFEESPSKKSVEAASDRLHETLPSPIVPDSPEERVYEILELCEQQRLCWEVQDPSAEFAGSQYVVGEKVSYYSASHGAWMPAKIVERKSRTIYVRASELVSENEEKTNPVLRAFTMLEKSEKKQKKRPSSATSARASSKPQSGPAVTVPGSRGRIVRDDFSDDSDND